MSALMGSKWRMGTVAGAIIALAVIVLLIVRSRERAASGGMESEGSQFASQAATNQHYLDNRPKARRNSNPATAEEIVASKVVQFGRDRRGLVREMARHYGVEVPAEVEKFFEAIEGGDWASAQGLFKAMRERMRGDEDPGGLIKLWPAILETYGAAEQAKLWPAQKLLDYGNAVLGSLREGMVYIGGTDEGRFIPTLLNETSEGSRHIILTQNAFADQSYLEYVNYLYGNRLGTLTKDESQRAFQEYMEEAQKRLKHDREFPNEPKQVRPGESIQMVENRLQVSGQVAVMDINERLLKMLLAKNPDISFAMQESFPLPSTHAGATALGPIFELRAQSEPMTPEAVSDAVNYWRGAKESLRADPEASGNVSTVQSWAHMAVGQGNLFAAQNHSGAAEETYRVAMEVAPHYFEPVGQLAKHLHQSGRTEEGLRLLQQFAGSHSEQRKTVDDFRSTWFSSNPPAKTSQSAFLEGTTSFTP